MGAGRIPFWCSHSNGDDGCDRDSCVELGLWLAHGLVALPVYSRGVVGRASGRASGSAFGIAAIVVAAVCTPTNVASAPPRGGSPAAFVSHGQTLSIGAPNAGSLVRGVKLEPSEHVRIVPAWSQPDFRWGLPELVQMVRRSAAHVNTKHGPSVLSVGDLSSRTGGVLRKHKSHQSGRDVDISFYIVGRDGKPVYHWGFVECDDAGNAKTIRGAKFDDARNWSLIEAMLSDPHAKVQSIFVANGLRKRLLIEAERQGASRQIRLEAARVMSLPNGAGPHADHFHIRIDCPSNQGDTCASAVRPAVRPSAASDATLVNTSKESANRGKRRRDGT